MVEADLTKESIQIKNKYIKHIFITKSGSQSYKQLNKLSNFDRIVIENCI